MKRATFYLAALALVVPAGQVLGNLVYNGDFELGNVGFTTQYTYSTDLTAPRRLVVGYDPQTYHPGAVSYKDHTSGYGRMLIANGATETDVTVWEQTVAVETDTEYVFFYWLSNWTDDDVRLAEIKCLINGAHVGLGFAPVAAGEWTFVFHRWNSGSQTEATIRLVDRDRAEVSNDFAIDDIGMIEIEDNYLLVVSSTEGGSVLVPGEGVFLYPEGELISLDAKCESGYEFARWGGNFFGHEHTLWVEMDNDYWATAQFKPLDYGVTIKASGSAPDAFATCSETADRLAVLSGALASGYQAGAVLGQPKDLCNATYLFPVVKPQGGPTAITKIVVNVYGSVTSAGAVVRIGDASPCRPVNGDVHVTFSALAAAALLAETEEPVYWLPVQVDAIMGVWDVAAVYLSYDCPSIPKGMLRRFHDHLSIYQALDAYAQDSSIRDLFNLRAAEKSAWEAVVQTLALTEDLAGSSDALRKAVDVGIEGLDGFLGNWASLLDPIDPVVLAGCGSEVIVERLDAAASSGRAYIAAYANAIADGSVVPEQARELDRYMADWKSGLMALQAALSDVFERLGRVHREAELPQEKPLRDAAERMIRAMTPWYTGEPDDFGFWVPASPTYLEEVIRDLQDFPEGQITVP